MSIASDDHLRRVMAQPVLAQELERWLRSNDYRMGEFERMMSDRSTVSQGTTVVYDDLYIWYRHNRIWERPEITLMTVLEEARPNAKRHSIQNFDCALICGVIFTYTQNGDQLVMQHMSVEPTGHWSLADDSQIGNATLKLMMANRA